MSTIGNEIDWGFAFQLLLAMGAYFGLGIMCVIFWQMWDETR